MLNEDIGTIDQPMLIARITAIATQAQAQGWRDLHDARRRGEFRKHAHAFLAWCTATGLAKHNALAGYRIPRQTREEMLADANGRRGQGAL